MRNQQLPSAIPSPQVVSEQGLLSYAVDQFDQIIYVDMDQNLQAAVLPLQDDENYAAIMELTEQVDELFLSQYVEGGQIYSYLLLEGDEIDIAKLQELGVVLEAEGMTSKNLG